MYCVQERLNGLLPGGILEAIGRENMNEAEELRLRRGYSPSLLIGGREKSLRAETVGAEDISFVLDRASRSSIHSVQSQLRRGFIQAGAGIRIGVCGAYTENGLGSGADISSLAIRLPKELKGIGKEAIDALHPFDSSVLIISPPGGGKTSFLREFIRRASEAGRRVSLCDERGEVAALWHGKNSFDLGPCTDVLSGLDKAEAIIMVLRAMNPELIALDEVSAGSDAFALEQAISCGANIIATAHGRNVEEIKRRPHYRKLLEQGMFEKAVIISGTGERSYEVVDL